MSRIKTLKKHPRHRSTASPMALRFKIVILCMTVFAIISIWIWYKGFVQRAYEGMENSVHVGAKNCGLRMDHFLFVGNMRTSKEDIVRSVDLSFGDSFLKIDLAESHRRLSQLPWVKQVRVERHWPNTLKVVLQERGPVALWQHKQKVYLVDAYGELITVPDIGPYVKLPLTMGKGAPGAVGELVEALADHPDFAKQALVFMRVGNRRWNVKFKNGLILLLPEAETKEALASFTALEKSHHLMAKAKKAIDWRIKNKFILS